MDGGGFGVPLYRLEDRIRLAIERTEYYKKMHGWVDVGIGAIGMVIPGASIPALIFSIGLQAPVIYQPLARDLRCIFLADPDELSDVQYNIIPKGAAITGTLDIAAHFGVEFVREMAKECFLEYGLGLAASVIPVLGGLVGGWLDYKIATAMTERVGKMVSIYFQNGAQWTGSKRETYEAARDLKGDIGSIRHNNDDVGKYLLGTVKHLIEMMCPYMNKTQMRDALLSKGVPEDLVDEALGVI